MALAVRTERAAAVRTRMHGEVPVSRTMVKTTVALPVSPRPRLTVVPRHRRTARLIAVGSGLVFSLMLGAAAFQTALARRQLEIDTLDRRIRTAHESYDELRRERAELRSPGRLAIEASALGMVPATQTEFITLDPDVIATVQRAGATPSSDHAPTIEDEFEAYADVKAQAGGAP
jgi:hypothetical protein